MSQLEDSHTLEYKGHRYTVVTIRHSNTTLPLLLDREIYKIIRNMNKVWYVNHMNQVYCLHQIDEETYQIYMHDLVLKIHNKIYSTDKQTESHKPIIHVNRINFDQRVDNLQYDVLDKNWAKNTRKKKRTISLKKYGINENNLPTYMWYLQPDQTHGGRFVVSIRDLIKWRSTSSKKVSCRYKCEEAKKYLRYIKKTRPELFDQFSMNGDLTQQGFKLLNEYNKMIEKVGYTIPLPPHQQETNTMIELDLSGLSDFEIYLLNQYNPAEGLLDIGMEMETFLNLSDQND
jgi:hypothetical protein